LVSRIEHVQIENRDAIQVLQSRNARGFFHYIDPPYPNADQGHYKGYTFEDLDKLLAWCEKCKGKFLLSNYNSKMLTEYIKRNGWNKEEFTFNNKGMRKNDLSRTEVLVWNYEQEGRTLKMFQ
jgi:DNA adenine methylase